MTYENDPHRRDDIRPRRADSRTATLIAVALGAVVLAILAATWLTPRSDVPRTTDSPTRTDSPPATPPAPKPQPNPAPTQK
jgi:hypothetical protein